MLSPPDVAEVDRLTTASEERLQSWSDRPLHPPLRGWTGPISSFDPHVFAFEVQVLNLPTSQFERTKYLEPQQSRAFLRPHAALVDGEDPQDGLPRTPSHENWQLLPGEASFS